MSDPAGGACQCGHRRLDHGYELTPCPDPNCPCETWCRIKDCPCAAFAAPVGSGEREATDDLCRNHGCHDWRCPSCKEAPARQVSVTDTDCCELEGEHTEQMFMLCWYPRTPDDYTLMCSNHVVKHLMDDRSTTVYPKGVEW